MDKEPTDLEELENVLWAFVILSGTVGAIVFGILWLMIRWMP